MFDRNLDAFYFEFKNNDGVEYRLEFYPAPTGALTAARTFHAFGEYVFDKKVSLKANLEESLPKGLQLASEMKIKIYLNELTGDFETVRKWIYLGQSMASIRPTNIYSSSSTDTKPVFLPNLWVLKKKKSSAWITQFIGYQVPVTEKGIKVNPRKGTQTFEFSAIDFTKWVGEKFDFKAQYTGLVRNWCGSYSQTTVKRYIDTEFHDTNPWMTAYYRSLSTAPDNCKYKFYQFSSFIADYYVAFTRFVKGFYSYDTSDILTNAITGISPITNFWEFFKQADYTLNYPKTSLGTNEPFFLAFIFDSEKDSIVGGFFSEDDGGVIKKCKTAWDYIKRLAEDFSCKITFDYENGGLKCNALLDHNRDILDIDSNSILIEEEYEPKSDFNMAGKGVAHVYEGLEYSWNQYGTLSDTTEEIEVLQSSAIPPIEKYTKAVSGLTINGVSCNVLNECRLSKPAYDGLYWPRKWDGNEAATDYEMVRVHPCAHVWLDNSKTFGGDWIPTDYSYIMPDYLDDDEDEIDTRFLENAVRFRQNYVGVSSAARTIWANLTATSNKCQCSIQIQTDVIEIGDLGRRVNIDLSLFKLDWALSDFKPKIFITDIEFEDLKKSLAKVTLFITADNY